MMLLFPICGLATPPPAENVFKISTKPLDPNTFILDWNIKPGFFLYQNRIDVQAQPEAGYKLGQINLPKAAKKKDDRGKTIEVYRSQLRILVPVLGKKPGETVVKVGFQGCADDGFCYPPQMQAIKLTFNDHLELDNAELMDTAVSAKNNVSEQTSKINSVLFSDNVFWIIIGFTGFGLLLSFTPCVLPMVPVLSGIIVGHGKNLSTRKAFLLSLCYVLSMSVTYAGVGALVALMGSNLQIMMQSPLVLSTFSLIFILLALSMFNLYELRLPASWQSKLANITRSQSSGHYLSAAIMGCLSTLVISPCVTAPLIGVLSYIAHTGNIGFGSMALFFLGLGMGLPLLLIGTSAGTLLPKAGSWMNTVKAFFGVLLLGVAIYLLERILPDIISMILWAGLLIFSGIFMGAFKQASVQREKLSQGAGIMLLVYGLLILIGASQGNTNPLQPLKSDAISMTQDSRSPADKTVSNVQEAQQALVAAKGTPVLLDFYADWCASCKVIAKTTLKNPEIIQALSKMTVIKIDLSANDQKTRELLNYFQVVAPPTFLFYDRYGKELSELRIVGEASVQSFVKNLHKTIAQNDSKKV